jgi:hypothetical protein
MIRSDVIDLINSGQCWAFIGSGASVDAKAPSWKKLVDELLSKFSIPDKKKIEELKKFNRAYALGEYQKCLSVIQEHSSRSFIESDVKRLFGSLTDPGKIHTLLADWPFAGYVTTNYDTLIENAVLHTSKQAWLSVGNTNNESRKVSGNASELVWHVHGAVALDESKSTLILTEEDYDNIYLEDSPVITQLRGLLSFRRVVFIGFGFNDPEVMRLLKRIGRFCNPAKPVYAVLADTDAQERRELLEKYNVNVIPYQSINGSHERLFDLLKVYSSFVVRRSTTYGQHIKKAPSYDPETTGLLLYNELCLKDSLPQGNLGVLLRARALSLLKYHGKLTTQAIVKRLAGSHETQNANLHYESAGHLEQLSTDGLIELDENGNWHLTRDGSELTESQAATSERLREQFQLSLQDRAHQALSNAKNAESVANIAEQFLNECISRRSLGVAMALAWKEDDRSDYHITALLQALPIFMNQLSSQDEAIALSELIQSFFTKPTDAESKYLGTALQAQFGIHLLGLDPDTIKARTRDFSDALFLVDSSTLIPLMARGSIASESAKHLIEQLNSLNSKVMTTDLLVEEVAEHARWAANLVKGKSGPLTVKTLEAVTGRTSTKSNAFLDGFLEELSQGLRAINDFNSYLTDIIGPVRNFLYCSRDDITQGLTKLGLSCNAFQDWEGFSETLWEQRESVKAKIKEAREQSGSFKHERQVEAEAEALIIIERLRSGELTVNGNQLSNAYFVSHTRVIDRIGGRGQPITMPSEAVRQWVETLRPSDISELSLLTNSLLWELSERGLSFVDNAKIRTVFSPLASAAKDKLDEEVEHHRAIVSELYGANASEAFKEVNSLDAPIVMESYYARKAEYLESEVQKERKAKQEAQKQAMLTKEDRQNLDNLKRDKERRRQKATKNRRASASKPKSKRRKKNK